MIDTDNFDFENVRIIAKYDDNDNIEAVLFIFKGFKEFDGDMLRLIRVFESLNMIYGFKFERTDRIYFNERLFNDQAERIDSVIVNIHKNVSSEGVMLSDLVAFRDI